MNPFSYFLLGIPLVLGQVRLSCEDTCLSQYEFDDFNTCQDLCISKKRRKHPINQTNPSYHNSTNYKRKSPFSSVSYEDNITFSSYSTISSTSLSHPTDYFSSGLKASYSTSSIHSCSDLNTSSSTFHSINRHTTTYVAFSTIHYAADTLLVTPDNLIYVFLPIVSLYTFT